MGGPKEMVQTRAGLKYHFTVEYSVVFISTYTTHSQITLKKYTF